jgi:hypothetical protein
MTEIRDHSPPILKMSMASPLRGDVGDPRVPTTYHDYVDGELPER